ncbi:HYC_CC_PP family protein [Algibacter lectus]|uniref:HYC_CC_PP family protein n=1 Tax=Algibacter lectus TaxID=221126 RepID=UPI00398A9EF5
MIKTILHKGFAILMTCLVLFSTVYFTIEKHFCGDVLIDVSVFSEAQNCGMKTGTVMHKESCCKDEVNVVTGQRELKFSSFDDLDFVHQQFISAFSHAFINLFEGLEQQIVPHKNYSPPNLVADILVLDQVFII